MSSNIPLINSTEDKNQDQEMAQNKVPSLDKSRSTQRTDIENTVNKPRSIPRTNL